MLVDYVATHIKRSVWTLVFGDSLSRRNYDGGCLLDQDILLITPSDR